jgi:hypothetical protein
MAWAPPCRGAPAPIDANTGAGRAVEHDATTELDDASPIVAPAVQRERDLGPDQRPCPARHDATTRGTPVAIAVCECWPAAEPGVSPLPARLAARGGGVTI